MLLMMLGVTSLTAADLPVVRTVPLRHTNGLSVGCPGLPPSIASEKGPRQKMRKLSELPGGQAYAAMFRSDLNCALPLTHRAPATLRR